MHLPSVQRHAFQPMVLFGKTGETDLPKHFQQDKSQFRPLPPEENMNINRTCGMTTLQNTLSLYGMSDVADNALDVMRKFLETLRAKGQNAINMPMLKAALQNLSPSQQGQIEQSLSSPTLGTLVSRVPIEAGRECLTQDMGKFPASEATIRHQIAYLPDDVRQPIETDMANGVISPELIEKTRKAFDDNKDNWSSKAISQNLMVLFLSQLGAQFQSVDLLNASGKEQALKAVLEENKPLWLFDNNNRTVETVRSGTNRVVMGHVYLVFPKNGHLYLSEPGRGDIVEIDPAVLKDKLDHPEPGGKCAGLILTAPPQPHPWERLVKTLDA
jgi:hypothetical protein